MDPATTLEAVAAGDGLVVFLTGAGISAESGIPTFRGPEGYWTVGSTHYAPGDLATRAMFAQRPDTVWSWYLHRRRVCADAKPNAGHEALVAIERALGDRFRLITQNVDGLHRRAGSSRTWAIHGDIGTMRCAAECTHDLAANPIPVDEPPDAWTDARRTALTCPRCGEWMRPHVLWFDEYYDEAWFRFDSSIAAASDAALLVTAGTSGATNLPMQVGRIAAARGATLIDVNPEPNPFADLARRTGGHACTGTTSEWLPRLARAFAGTT